MAKKDNNIDKDVVKEEKEEAYRKQFPVIYYVLIFLTVLSTLFIGSAAVQSVGLSDKYVDVIKNSNVDTYSRFYRSFYQRDGMYYLGISGFVLTVGLYVVTKIRKEQ